MLIYGMFHIFFSEDQGWRKHPEIFQKWRPSRPKNHGFPVGLQVLAMDTLCEQEPDRFQDLLVRLSRRIAGIHEGFL